MVDETIRRPSTPSWMQVAAYNGWKRVHGIKFQSLFLPNGLIGHLWRPEMCTTGDSLMMLHAGTEQLMARVNEKSGLDRCFYYLYGDPAYAFADWMQVCHKGYTLQHAC